MDAEKTGSSQEGFVQRHVNTKSDAFDFDVAILGGGSAGYAAARTAAGACLRAVVIEGGEEVGGLCLLRGCMPTKALLYAAEVLHRARHLEPWGVRGENVGFDWAEVMARKRALIQGFVEDRRAQLTGGGFKFLRGTATFLDPHHVAVSNLGTISAAHFVIASGSMVAPAPLPQLGPVGYLTSDDVLSLTELPQSLIILGGGPVAVEFAQLFARFDVKITLLQRSAQLLSGCDRDMATVPPKLFREGLRGCRGLASGSSPSASQNA